MVFIITVFFDIVGKNENLPAGREKEGAGAAGDSGFAFQTFLNGKLVSGFFSFMKK